MVRELHEMGYERVRIMPGLSPSGCHWRATVAPASRFYRENGARCHLWGADDRVDKSLPRYTTAQGSRYFGWTDAADDSPQQLAKKFLERFPAIASVGRGDDPEYVRWYADMLDATHPDGLIYAVADFPVPEDRLATINVPEDVKIALPPGGTFGVGDSGK
jgi:hypothetical protein